jgi:hypothetical protein
MHAAKASKTRPPVNTLHPKLEGGTIVGPPEAQVLFEREVADRRKAEAAKAKP